MSAPPECDVLLLTFSTGEHIRDDIATLCAALNSSGLRTHMRVLTEQKGIAVPAGLEAIECARGSKLDKLKSQLDIVHNPFVCVVDSDMHLNVDNCVAVVLQAFGTSPGIAFGLVESWRGPGVLGSCVQLDKSWSHRFLRPLLLRTGIGITIPGQFVVYSPALLAGIVDGTDTFLDDLYFGLRCRQKRLPMLRVDLVVGYEEGRSGWGGLLLQRTRWMKGLFSLARSGLTDGASAYCVAHYLAYHGIPVAYAASIVCFTCTGHELIAGALMAAFLVPFALVTRSISPAILVYSLTFPVIHILATIGAAMPLSLKSIRKR